MYARILVPTDGSLTAQRAVHHAVERARTDDAELHAVHVIDTRSPIAGTTPPLPDWDEAVDQLRAKARERLEEAIQAAGEEDLDLTKRVLERRGVAEAILTYADEHDVDIIFMGTHGRSGIERFLLGSVAERVVRKGHRPVTLIPPEEEP